MLCLYLMIDIKSFPGSQGHHGDGPARQTVSEELVIIVCMLKHQVIKDVIHRGTQDNAATAGLVDERIDQGKLRIHRVV